MVTSDIIPRLLCARCRGNAVVHQVEQMTSEDSVLLWVECHKHALVILPAGTIFAKRDVVELVDLRDITDRATDMWQRAEDVILEASRRADWLTKFLKVAHA